MALCVGALLGACSKEAPQGSAKEPAPVTVAPVAAPSAPAAPPASTTPGSATLKRASLMALVFPGWQDGDKARRGEVRLPKLDDKGKPVPGSATAQKAQITPREVVRLDESHAVMLTETVELDDQGLPNDSHVAGAWLGAYFFEQGANGWLPVARNDAVEYMGMSGSFGQTAVARIAPQRYVFTATYGSCWQGYCGGWLSTFGLGAREVAALVDAIPVAASNTGADEACEQVLSGKPAGAGAPRPNGECFDVAGKPAFALGTDEAPGELRIQFTGAKSPAANRGRARVEKVDVATVYRLQNGRYALSEGRNPVPSF